MIISNARKNVIIRVIYSQTHYILFVLRPKFRKIGAKVTRDGGKKNNKIATFLISLVNPTIIITLHSCLVIKFINIINCLLNDNK